MSWMVRAIDDDCNVGICNTGNYNTGDYNVGNGNSGDWNDCDYSNGCFNTISPKIHLFNKPSEWTYEDWLDSKAYCLLVERIPMNKTRDRVVMSNWWYELSNENKNIIKSIPNFDPVIFKEITGIDVEE